MGHSEVEHIVLKNENLILFKTLNRKVAFKYVHGRLFHFIPPTEVLPAFAQFPPSVFYLSKNLLWLVFNASLQPSLITRLKFVSLLWSTSIRACFMVCNRLNCRRRTSFVSKGIKEPSAFEA